jgi:hypothetical protein
MRRCVSNMARMQRSRRKTQFLYSQVDATTHCFPEQGPVSTQKAQPDVMSDLSVRSVDINT